MDSNLVVDMLTVTCLLLFKKSLNTTAWVSSVILQVGFAINGMNWLKLSPQVWRVNYIEK